MSLYGPPIFRSLLNGLVFFLLFAIDVLCVFIRCRFNCVCRFYIKKNGHKGEWGYSIWYMLKLNVNGNDMHLVGINLFTFFILKIYWKLYIFWKIYLTIYKGILMCFLLIFSFLYLNKN